MTEVSIAIHADGPPEFRTSDAATVEALRQALGPQTSHLVIAHDLAEALRAAGRKLWAARLDQEEEAHVVTVRFSP
jgi:hypothetical protein